MTGTATIRTLSSADWRTYKSLRLQSLADAPDAFSMTAAEAAERADVDWAERLSERDISGTNLPLLAEAGDRPIGLAWGRIESRRREIAHVYQMWMHPSFRRMGVGRQLLDAMIAWARAQKADYVDLGVTCGDSAARRLYERAGFEPIGTPEPLRRGSQTTAQPMRLRLG